MSTDTKNLPPIKLSNEFYELIRLYAFRTKTSMSSAVRQLLKESPAIINLAREQSLDLDQMNMPSWGGSRRPESDADDV